jgi:hypothetical protein
MAHIQKSLTTASHCGQNVIAITPSVRVSHFIAASLLRLRIRFLFLSVLTLPSVGFAANHAANEAACELQLLESFGWQIVKKSPPAKPATSTAASTAQAKHTNANTCYSGGSPKFHLYSNEKNNQLRARVSSALASDTTRCLFNQALKQSAAEATGKIIANTAFTFPKPGEDPRDPFTPPASSWQPSSKRGYDHPVQSLTHGVRSLYREPVIAECASAIQVAQLATLVEHFNDESDQFVTPGEIGIGVWREFVKSPSIRANKPLLISRKQRKYALKRLAGLGQGAFYNQSGYIRPVNDSWEYIDSTDNRGQNFLILNITRQAVNDLRARQRPLRELNRITLEIWDTYDRLRKTGLDMDILVELLEKELLATDTFFSDITVYIHPLRTGTFAKFLARQFRYNPRTAYKFEVYEDFQTGYFFDQYVGYRLSQCEHTANRK